MQKIYLDNSATTPVDRDVADLAVSLMCTDYGNPSSLHGIGLSAQLRLDRAREQLAGALDCSPGELVFTSGGTEANNLALAGAAQAMHRRGKTIVSTAVEHASVLAVLKRLEAQGFTVKLAPPQADGNLDPAALADLVDDDTVLVSCMLVNSEVGAVLPVAQAAKLVRRKNKQTVIHCDAVQAFGKIPVVPHKLGVDLLTVSAHKIHGPKGCGALYIRKGARIIPQLLGGSQEQGRRGGTENTALACAFGLAAEKAIRHREEHLRQVTELYEYFVKTGSTTPGVCINSPGDGTPYICNLSVPGFRSEILLHFLESKGIYISSGSACSKGAKSHVLQAMGLPPERVDSALRVSFSHYSTLGEAQCFWEALEAGINTLAKQ